MNIPSKLGLSVGLLLLLGFLALGALRGRPDLDHLRQRFANFAVTPQATEPEDLSCRAPSPPATFEIDSTSPAGRTHRINRGPSAARDLQAALDKANPGDVIELEPGADFIGNFTLPRKQGDAWVTIRPAAGGALLPQGARVTPAAAPSLPHLLTPNADPVLQTAPGAHHYRLVGLELAVAAGVKRNNGLVLLGDGSGAQRSLPTVPHDLVLDRCYIHGNGTGELRRGVALNSARTAVVNSYIAACHGVGYDTQAISGWNGPGPFKIINNYLEGAGENVMFGGGDPAIPNLVPSDIEFRDNHCAKPLAWKASNRPAESGRAPTVKNIFELKNARRVLVEGNVFERNWVDGQTGYAILFTVRNQDGGAPWSTVEDVVFRGNVVRSASAGLNLLGRDDNHPSRQLKRLRIEQNLFEDIGGAQWGGNGCFLQLTESSCVVVDRNTVLQTGKVLSSYGQPSSNFAFTNNAARHNEYGVLGDNQAIGRSTLEKYFPAVQFTGNVLAGGPRAVYPAGNFFPPTLDLEAAAKRAIGADVTALRTHMAKVQAGK